MSLLNYFAEAEDNRVDLKNKLVELFVDKKPTDSDIHKFAEDNSIDPHSLENIIYEILYDVFHDGLSKGKTDGFDEEQVKMGMEVEKEHTSIPQLARKILSDHLTEDSNYYTKLAEMEGKTKNEQKNNLFNQLDRYFDDWSDK